MPKFLTEQAQITTDSTAAGDGAMHAATDVAQADVRGMTNMVITLDQITDNGTVTLHVDVSYDGNNWVPDFSASVADTDFPAGTNMSIAIPASDSHGMPLLFTAVRARMTAHTGTGAYAMHVTGLQLDGYR
jgi:hypothetical protein